MRATCHIELTFRLNYVDGVRHTLTWEKTLVEGHIEAL